ncbi:hypothetical protein, partial [Acinetobacter baumannii]|uniref:hypothetical protein n=1 Tax=Acinetobacter baumannii TaxID=470 RepID=UPI001C08E4F3
RGTATRSWWRSGCSDGSILAGAVRHKPALGSTATVLIQSSGFSSPSERAFDFGTGFSRRVERHAGHALEQRGAVAAGVAGAGD